jgi:hypothetical protein
MEGFGFQELSEVYRAEMYANPLSKVRKDLYRAMAELLRDLGRECFRLESADPESLMLIGARDKRSKAEMMAKQISFLRARKVFNRSILAAEGMDASLEDLTPEEERYYYEVLAANRRQLSVVRDYLDCSQCIYETDGHGFGSLSEDSDETMCWFASTRICRISRDATGRTRCPRRT